MGFNTFLCGSGPRRAQHVIKGRLVEGRVLDVLSNTPEHTAPPQPHVPGAGNSWPGRSALSNVPALEPHALRQPSLVGFRCINAMDRQRFAIFRPGLGSFSSL